MERIVNSISKHNRDVTMTLTFFLQVAQVVVYVFSCASACCGFTTRFDFFPIYNCWEVLLNCYLFRCRFSYKT